MFSKLKDNVLGSIRPCKDCKQSMVMKARNQIRCPACRDAKAKQASKVAHPYYKVEKCITQ